MGDRDKETRLYAFIQERIEVYIKHSRGNWEKANAEGDSGSRAQATGSILAMDWLKDELRDYTKRHYPAQKG